MRRSIFKFWFPAQIIASWTKCSTWTNSGGRQYFYVRLTQGHIRTNQGSWDLNWGLFDSRALVPGHSAHLLCSNKMPHWHSGFQMHLKWLVRTNQLSVLVDLEKSTKWTLHTPKVRIWPWRVDSSPLWSAWNHHFKHYITTPLEWSTQKLRDVFSFPF